MQEKKVSFNVQIDESCKATWTTASIRWNVTQTSLIKTVTDLVRAGLGRPAELEWDFHKDDLADLGEEIRGNAQLLTSQNVYGRRRPELTPKLICPLSTPLETRDGEPATITAAGHTMGVWKFEGVIHRSDGEDECSWFGEYKNGEWQLWAENKDVESFDDLRPQTQRVSK